MDIPPGQSLWDGAKQQPWPPSFNATRGPQTLPGTVWQRLAMER